MPITSGLERSRRVLSELKGKWFMKFKDRAEAGAQLAQLLLAYKPANAIICPLPRGGVVLGVEIARALGAPVELLIPRKIGHPYNPEYAVGAITESGQAVWNEAEVSQLDQAWLQSEAAKEQAEARRRRLAYTGRNERISLTGKIVILVDDGIATGLTMLAAIREAKAQKPAKIVVAVPVLPDDTVSVLELEGVIVEALEVPALYLGAVGAYYNRFDQVSDDEVKRLLASIN